MHVCAYLYIFTYINTYVNKCACTYIFTYVYANEYIVKNAGNDIYEGRLVVFKGISTFVDYSMTNPFLYK